MGDEGRHRTAPAVERVVAAEHDRRVAQRLGELERDVARVGVGRHVEAYRPFGPGSDRVAQGALGTGRSGADGGDGGAEPFGEPEGQLQRGTVGRRDAGEAVVGGVGPEWAAVETSRCPLEAHRDRARRSRPARRGDCAGVAGAHVRRKTTPWPPSG